MIEFTLTELPKGINIYAKSPAFEEFFKSISTRYLKTPDLLLQGQGPGWTGLQGYPAHINNWDEFAMWDCSTPISGNIVNLSYLRTIGLKDGIEITFHHPYNSDVVNKYKELATKRISKFYKQFIALVDIDDDLGVLEV